MLNVLMEIDNKQEWMGKLSDGSSKKEPKINFKMLQKYQKH